MLAQLLILTLSSVAPELATPRLKIAAPQISVVNIDEGPRDFLTEQIAQELADSGAEVITARDIQTLLGMERQRQLLGCGEEAAACIAELASALGADAVLVGDVAKLETSWRANLKLLSQKDASVVARWSHRAASLEGLIDDFRLGARELVPEAARKLERSLAPAKPVASASSEGGGISWVTWIPAVAGAASGAVAGYAVSQASENYRGLASEADSVTQAQTYRDDGSSWQRIAWIGGGLAVVGLGTTAVLLLTRDRGEPAVTPNVMLTPHGATFGISGVLP